MFVCTHVCVVLNRLALVPAFRCEDSLGLHLCKLSIFGFSTVEVEQRNLTTSLEGLGNCDGHYLFFLSFYRHNPQCRL